MTSPRYTLKKSHQGLCGPYSNDPALYEYMQKKCLASQTFSGARGGIRLCPGPLPFLQFRSGLSQHLRAEHHQQRPPCSLPPSGSLTRPRVPGHAPFESHDIGSSLCQCAPACLSRSSVPAITSPSFCFLPTVFLSCFLAFNVQTRVDPVTTSSISHFLPLALSLSLFSFGVVFVDDPFIFLTE